MTSTDGLCVCKSVKKCSRDQASCTLEYFLKGQHAIKLNHRMPPNPAGIIVLSYSFIACFYSTFTLKNYLLSIFNPPLKGHLYKNNRERNNKISMGNFSIHLNTSIDYYIR